MNINTLRANRRLIRQYIKIGVVVGFFYAIVEYFARLGSDDPVVFGPLLIRTLLSAGLITASAGIFEILSKELFAQKRFAFLVLVRSTVYTLVITFWLSVVNGFWGMIEDGYSFVVGMLDYWGDQGFLVNLISVFLLLILLIGFRQINSLHKKGELFRFIIGKYHQPREVERIFCFIDLKNSTTIAERLGHFRFASFLKDYYSDITEAIRKTDAEIYQYVGDEIVLSWPYKSGLKNNNLLHCFFMMKEIMQILKGKYLDKYGVYPDFKAGIHGGRVMVTWVGEIKREIVYIGDVLNTTARIQEDCKRLAKDFLISEELLNRLEGLNGFAASFIEETVPRGKARKVKLYSLEMV